MIRSSEEAVAYMNSGLDWHDTVWFCLPLVKALKIVSPTLCVHTYTCIYIVTFSENFATFLPPECTVLILYFCSLCAPLFGPSRTSCKYLKYTTRPVSDRA